MTDLYNNVLIQHNGMDHIKLVIVFLFATAAVMEYTLLNLAFNLLLQITVVKIYGWSISALNLLLSQKFICRQ